MIHEFPDPITRKTITYNPPLDELRAIAQDDETTTEFGSPAYESRVRSRNADRTINTIDDELLADDRIHIKQGLELVEDVPFVCLDRQLGRHDELSFSCRLFVPKEYARVALSWAKLLEPSETEPDFITLQIPDWEETRIRVFPDEKVTYVFGSDYTGEAKKSFLRLFMYEAKNKGGLGLHAGTKNIHVSQNGNSKNVGQLFLGLSATGKTTLTCHDFNFDAPNSAELVQDDVCALLPSGVAAGSEGGGLYIKTLGLSNDTHGPLYKAATQPTAVLENVAVSESGHVDFSDSSLTTNARATITRDDLPNAASEIDLQKVDHVFFITRNPLMPPVAKLSPAAAAAAFMLGESIQTSAGDPSRAGEAIRVVGTNPFIIGSEGREGSRFLNLVRSNDIQCFVINTGHLGDEAKDITVDTTVAVLRAVTRDEITWQDDELLDLTIPREVPGIDITDYYPPDYVADYAEKLESLRVDRQSFLSQFDNLSREITESSLVTPVEQTRLE